jgi:putative transposase
MVLYRRSRAAGGTFFFTVNLYDRQSAVLIDHVDAFRAIVREVKDKHPFRIDAMVVLPEHWHAVWTMPVDDVDYAKRIRLIKGQFTKHLVQIGVPITRNARGEYNVWQQRYWEHTIRDDRDFENHINYVHINPVKHGYVQRASDWPHSTIHLFIERGILSVDWATSAHERDYGE